jgi:hypothetical protein
MESEQSGQSGIRVTAEGATPQELAAILAAVEALWPKPGVDARTPPDPGAWRFSGRWWRAGDLPIRRFRTGLGS